MNEYKVEGNIAASNMPNGATSPESSFGAPSTANSSQSNVTNDGVTVVTKEVETLDINADNPTVSSESRFRPGTVALRELRRFKQAANVEKCVSPEIFHEILSQVCEDEEMQFEDKAIEALLAGTEAMLIDLFSDANLYAISEQRVTLLPKDVQRASKRKHENKFARGEAKKIRRDDENEHVEDEEDGGVDDGAFEELNTSKDHDTTTNDDGEQSVSVNRAATATNGPYVQNYEPL